MLIYYIPEPIRKTAGGVKDQIMSILKPRIILKQSKTVFGSGKKQSEEIIVKSIKIFLH